MREKVMILRDSDEAAQLKTVTGWVSSDGRFFGDDESTARYAGCTHQLCECGEVVDKHKVRCDACYRKMRFEAFKSLETRVWNGEPLVNDEDDHYFFSMDDLLDYCFDIGMQPQDLQLRLCDPQYGREIDSSYFCDELADDGELPDSIQEAMAALNKAIQDSGPLSWYPSKYAAIIPDEFRVNLNTNALGKVDIPAKSIR